MPQHNLDFAVIGGGIVGLATAYQLHLRYPNVRIALLEKETRVGSHQSGRNSGVLHSGIYYKPGSLKAINCRQGKLLMEQFCERESIRYERCGKVIVAVDETEIPLLEKIHDRGRGNQVACQRIDAKQLRELEPYAAGVTALHVTEAGIVDYPHVCRRLAEILTENGHSVLLDSEVTSVRLNSKYVELQTEKSRIQADYVINCAGLHSDRVLRLAGDTPPARIIPFRGEYYQLKPEHRHLCRNLIYPVPDPEFPFLGVHLTRMVDGSVECGPNAVLALAREGYNWLTLNPRDLFESLTYGGFLKMAAKHWYKGAGEIKRSLFKSAFVNALKRLVPDLQENHLIPCRAGVRAQAVGPDGSLVDDFLFRKQNRMIHVCNAPSPAATASLKIGESIVEELAGVMKENSAA
jgi:L-2-hydroxyglutarate oxidase